MFTKFSGSHIYVNCTSMNIILECCSIHVTWNFTIHTLIFKKKVWMYFLWRLPFLIICEAITQENCTLSPRLSHTHKHPSEVKIISFTQIIGHTVATPHNLLLRDCHSLTCHIVGLCSPKIFLLIFKIKISQGTDDSHFST